MTELRELIQTERVVPSRDGSAVHAHQQLFTKRGELVVEWCLFQDGCEYVAPPEVEE
jgi:hypothetical protein